MTFLESIILGIIQGVTEWLPVSSSGMVSLVSLSFFGRDLGESISFSFFLHFGTFLAVLVYFWSDLKNIFLDKKLLKFLFISTLVTFPVAGVLFLGLSKISFSFSIAIIVVGVLLIITGLLQLYRKKTIAKKELDYKDGWLVGAMQGLAILPGLSRSGLTLYGLILKKYSPKDALRLSFLMSIPVVFLGEIVLTVFNITFSRQNFFIDLPSLIGLLVAFVVGFLSIKVFLQIAEKINFAWFVIVIGLFSILGGLFI